MVKVIQVAKEREVFLRTSQGMMTAEDIMRRFFYREFGYLSGKHVPEETAVHPAIIELVTKERLNALKSKFRSL